jgi:putative phosphoribosyl transferase
VIHRPFADRAAAGRRLAERLASQRSQNPVVIGLPRGGIVVAFEVAQALGAPLDVHCVRKVTVPEEPELAIGAVDEEGGVVLNRHLVEQAGISEDRLLELVRGESREVAERAARYRAVRPRLSLDGRTALLVDDGMTTGMSASAAAHALRGRGAAKIVLAVPVSPRETVESVRATFHEVVCLETPPLLLTLEEWYSSFPEISDEDAARLLALAGSRIEI